MNDGLEWAHEAGVDTRTPANELASILERAIRSGRIAVGTKLLTQRALADRLSINVGTISRAYRQLKDTGLISARRRHGSFVNAVGPITVEQQTSDRAVNLRTFTTTSDLFVDLFQTTLSDLCNDTEQLRAISCYRTYDMLASDRGTIAQSLSAGGESVDPDAMLFADNGTNAITTALIAFCKPGDTIVAEALTLPGLLVAARVLGLNIVGVPIDRDGVVPDELEAICAETKPKLLVCMPVIQNPTCVSMPEERRRALTKVLAKHDVLLVEDDLYSDLVPVNERLPRMASFYLERTIVIGSPSKTLAQIVRSGYIIAPNALRSALAESLSAQTLFAPGLTTHLWARMIASGAAETHLAYLRSELAIRAEILRAAVPSSTSHALSPFAWVPLPTGSSATEFGMRALFAGVSMRNSDEFQVPGATHMPGVRVNLLGCRSIEDYRRGVRIIADVLSGSDRGADIQP